MRRGLFLAVAALSTNTQGAVVDKRQNIQVDGNGNVNVEGPGAAGVRVTTLDLADAGAVLGNGAGSGQGNIIAGILDALNGNRNGANGANCPPPAPPAPPVTVTKTVYQNASMPSPLTVFVTQQAAPLTVTMFVTPTAPPAAAPPAAACPPAVTPAASSAPAATSKPGLVIPGTPQPPPFAGLLSSSSIPPPPAATPAPVAAEPPSSRSAALPQVGGPAGNSNPTKSLNLGGLTSAAAAQPVSEATPPVAANPAQPQIDVSGLALSKSLQLGNLLQQTAKLQARETARL